MSRFKFVVALIATSALALPAGAQAASEALVNVGSPPAPFPQNKQNEPGLAIDPTNPSVVAAGSNDEIDVAPCDGASCPFTEGVGVSGIYFSFNGGSSWSQPTYDGYSARSGTPGPGPIGTLPNFYENGLVSDGDPVLAYGPKPDGRGGFTYANGSRLYYSSLAASFPGASTFKGFEAITVSHTDSVQAAATGSEDAWSDPVIATKQSSTTFSDKEAVWADNARSSKYFGNVYLCYTQFRSQSGPPEPIFFARSTNGGRSFQKAYHLSPAYNSNQNPGRQGCAVRTDSKGNVYATWEDTVKKQSVFRMAVSTDGGRKFGKAVTVANVTDVGQFDGVRSISFDGVAGARTSSFPSLDIANGAPDGNGPDTLAIGWSDGADGINHEHALVQLSSNEGRSWTTPRRVEQSGDRPDFAFIGISPDGTDLYTVYDGFTDPFRNDTTSPRRFQGVVRHSNVSGTTLSGTATLDRGAVGDARASSANSLVDEFLGDYNTVDATNDSAVAVFNDARNATVCPAINGFRQDTVDSGGAGELGEVDERDEEPLAGGDAPAPALDCPPRFGNTDIYSSLSADPTP